MTKGKFKHFFTSDEVSAVEDIFMIVQREETGQMLITPTGEYYLFEKCFRKERKRSS